MMSLGEQERPEGCPSDLAFDNWFSRDLAPEQRLHLEAHLQECARCRRRHAAFSEERAAFLAERPWTGPGSHGVRKKAQRLWAIVPALAAAAAVTLWLVRTSDVGDGGVRLKGAEHVGYFIEHAQGAERGAPERPVHPGDRIRFTYSSAGPAYLAIYAFDASGVASVYFPAGEIAAHLGPGSDVPLGSTVELDAVLGQERIFALFCDAAFRVESHREALARQKTLGTPAGCRLSAFEWRKEPPPQ